MADPSPSLLRRLLRFPAECLVMIYVVADAVFAPLFRPFMRWLSRLRLIQAVERWIAGLPPYVLLVLLVVPFAVAELAKAYAVVLMGTGHFKTGLVIFIGAYVVSILVCERIFHAGKDQLMTIGWFKTGFTWVTAVKDKLLAWARTTRVWQLAGTLRQKARIAVRRIRTRVASLLGRQPPGSFGRG